VITNERPGPVKVAAWSARHPWWAIAAWIGFMLLCVGAGAATGTKSTVVSDFWIGEAGRAEAIAAEAGLTPPAVEQVLISGPSAALDAAAREVAARMRALPEVASVGDAVRSADGSAVRVPVTMAAPPDAAADAVDALERQTAAAQEARPELLIVQTGDASMSAGVDDNLGQDLARTEMISLPVTFLILLLVFGAVLAAAVPVLLAVSAFVGSVGLYAVASWAFPDAGGAAVSVVFLLGMAVGVDYALFYVKRVREEQVRAGGLLSPATAVEAAAATSGRAVLTSGIAVIASLAALYVVEDVIFSSIATGAILVVVVALASSLTVLPALLVVLGRWMTQGLITQRRRHAKGSESRWAAVLQPALRRPGVTLVAGLVCVAAVALPALGMRLGTEGAETFPRSVPAVDAYNRLVAAFPDTGPSHIVVVRATPGADVPAALTKLAARTRDDALFWPSPEIRASADRTTWTLRVPVPHGENSPEALASLERLRGQLLPATLQRTGVEYAVTGEVARGVDYAAHQNGRIPWVAGLVSLATFVVMLVAFGSVPLAAIGVAVNLAAVAVSWGVLTIVFQGTWAQALLNFTSTGFVGSRMPMMIFAILAGLSTDYQIFVVSRIREAVQRGVPTRQAVRDGIVGSASVVTSAAVIMLSVFASFLFIDRIELKQAAVGLSVAVLFDALVLRILILPAVMTLLGERSWWPWRRSAPQPDEIPVRT
jgi:RND superfamily putative drug exporter